MGVCVWGFFLSMQCNKCWTWIQTRILAYISTAPKWTLCKLNVDVMCCCCWSQCTWINCVQLFLYGFPFAQFLFRYVNFTFLWSHTVFVHVYFACAWIRCRVRRQQMHKIEVFFSFCLSMHFYSNGDPFILCHLYDVPILFILNFIPFFLHFTLWMNISKKEKLYSNEQPNWMNSNVKASIVVITHHHQ